MRNKSGGLDSTLTRDREKKGSIKKDREEEIKRLCRQEDFLLLIGGKNGRQFRESLGEYLRLGKRGEGQSKKGYRKKRARSIKSLYSLSSTSQMTPGTRESFQAGGADGRVKAAPEKGRCWGQLSPATNSQAVRQSIAGIGDLKLLDEQEANNGGGGLCAPRNVAPIQPARENSSGEGAPPGPVEIFSETYPIVQRRVEGEFKKGFSYFSGEEHMTSGKWGGHLTND